ncbi:alpha/beta hydrolase family protein [Entomoplasma freundtii]|uniref:Hydrolase n=1 Tax=Entomoplasma freundtii TaxID=74700 RepID=A0A2K8NRS4_9MOLU|nr:alpha/beta fold hydrolase [Entomoplasma freundtii]ATZ16509.1 hydrolase [Entomoplasma freundtii]TDY56039.1 alpha/beta hydrolase family protein [Entomoplasma freundtii]
MEKEDDSVLARGFINLWNNHFSPTIYRREDGRDAKLNVVKMFNWNPTNFNSNAKLKIADKEPNANIFIPSKDGIKLGTSIWLNDKPTNKWIVGIHGYNSSRFDVLYLTWHYRDLGYNIITFDFRNHGASDNDAVTWGYKEKWDLIAVIEWLIKAYKVEEMGLIGTSMGAFTLNYFMLTEPELIKKANIRWGISDSGYMAVPKLLQRMVSNNSPRFLDRVTSNTLKVMMNIYKKEYGVDFSKLDFISLIKPGEYHPPVFYVHNRGDRITDYLDSFRMWKIKNNLEETEDNEVFIFDGRHHTKALVEYTDEYKDLTLKFVQKHQKQPK